jgi:hypothetical protein
MKKFLNFPSLMLVFVSALFLVSCEEEPGGGSGGGTTDSAAAISLVSESELTLAPSEEFTVSIAADKGTNDMNAITVYEDGIKVPVDRLKFNGTEASSNAVLLIGSDRESLDWTVSIVAQATAGTTSNFEVEIIDDMNLTSAVTVTVTTASSPPTLTGLGNPTPTFTEGTQNVSLKIQAEKGGADLSTLEIRENDVLVDVTNFNWNGLSMMTMGNPFGLSDTESQGFDEGEFLLDLPNSVGTFVYTIIVEDAVDQRDTATFVITTESSGTPIDIREDVLLNAAGPAGTGGLDLDTGESTGTGPVSGAEAEIIDNGINGGNADVNWIQTISAVNGATMKYVVAGSGGVPESFTFDGLEFKEDLEGLYTANSGGVIDNTNSSSIVQPGDTFIVQKGTQYWLITAKEVNVKTAVGDNSDNYVFDVKF